MNKIISFLLANIMSISVIFAHVPQAFNYTGIAYGSNGKVISNQDISVLAEILDGSAEGPSVFSEIHYVTTDNKGFFSIPVGGADNSLPEGSLGGIEWGDAPKWLAISIDPKGATDFQLVGSVQLLSVPYALHAESADGISGDAGYFADGGEAAEADRTLGNTNDFGLGIITNGQTRLHVTNEGNVGIGTADPYRRFELVTDQDVSTITATTYRASMFTAGFFNGRGARGTQAEPLPVLEHDWLATFNGNGYGSTGFSTFSRARIGMRAAEDWTDEDQGTYIIFATTPTGGTQVTERMRITDDGRVGIGTEYPDVDFEIATDQATCQMTATTYNPSGFTAGMFEGRAARGTQEDPQPVQEGDWLVTYNGNGFAPSGFPNHSRARIAMRAAENWTDDAQGAYMSFWTTPGGTTSRTEHMRITDLGNIGIGTTDPQSTLHVDGGIQVADDLDPPTPNKVGTLRYRAEPNASFVEMCMQIGPGAYAWVSIKQFLW